MNTERYNARSCMERTASTVTTARNRDRAVTVQVTDYEVLEYLQQADQAAAC